MNTVRAGLAAAAVVLAVAVYLLTRGMVIVGVAGIAVAVVLAVLLGREGIQARRLARR